jgi:hypothetical protein
MGQQFRTSSGSTGGRSGLIHRFDQAGKHSLDFVDSRMHGLKLFWHEKVQVLRQYGVVLQFVSRAQRNMQELPQFLVRRASTTLCDVGGNRRRSSSYLTRQPQKLLPRKYRGYVVNAQCQRMTLLPDLQFCIILQLSPRNPTLYTIRLYISFSKLLKSRVYPGSERNSEQCQRPSQAHNIERATGRSGCSPSLNFELATENCELRVPLC